MDVDIHIKELKLIAQNAGKLILEVYNQDFEESIGYKTDFSPLTVADKKSHDYITRELKQLFPEIPIISEEGQDISYEERKDWPAFWLIDPLDGTKEFIKKNEQFTINIALIRDNLPTFGLISTPCTGKIHYTENGKAYVEDSKGDLQKLQVNNKKENLIAIRSRSHAAPEEVDLFRKYKVIDYTSMGSALKFCMIAEGKADIYYRYKPTMEWDTAAGQAIVEAAGGNVFEGLSNKQFSYNKPSLVNGSFLCVGFGSS
jgi:3'(2'), 5'-bisphosphate nucleotidase